MPSASQCRTPPKTETARKTRVVKKDPDDTESTDDEPAALYDEFRIIEQDARDQVDAGGFVPKLTRSQTKKWFEK